MPEDSLATLGESLGSWKIAAVNSFLCSLATAPENSLDDTKEVCQFVGTPSVECYSKRIFPTRVTRGLISNSRRIVIKASSVLVSQLAKQVPCLVSPTPPCGCQAQGFGSRITK
jgi:hypothetical protein